MMRDDDPRRLIARLAVALAAADGHVTADELEAVTELDLLGLGHLSAIAEEELLAAVEQPIDLCETCDGLVRLGPQTGAIILTVLAHVVASDGTVSSPEGEAFATIARGLGIVAHEAKHILDAAVAAARARRTSPEPAGDGDEPPGAPTVRTAPNRSEAAKARRLLGVEEGAPPERLEAAYLAAVERYDPAKMTAFGTDFVRLAVRKLAEMTDAFDKARAAA